MSPLHCRGGFKGPLGRGVEMLIRVNANMIEGAA